MDDLMLSWEDKVRHVSMKEEGRGFRGFFNFYTSWKGKWLCFVLQKIFYICDYFMSDSILSTDQWFSMTTEKVIWNTFSNGKGSKRTVYD